MKAVILPTGNLESMDPLTTWMPEYLLPVGNKPIIVHIIELLVRNNIRDIILVVKHKYHETEQYLDKGQKWGVNITYMSELNDGGIGNLLKSISFKPDETFLCLPGNMVADLNVSYFIAAHKSSHALLTLSKVSYDKNDNLVPFSKEQPDDINKFVPFVIAQDGLDCIRSEREVPHSFEQILTLLTSHKHLINIYYSPHDFKAVDSVKDYLKTNKWILSNYHYNGLIIEGKQIEQNITIGRKTKIHPDVTLEPPLLIGNNCSIHSGVAISKGVVIGDNVIVDKGSYIEGSIIMDNTYIGSHIEVRDSIIRKNCMVKVPSLVDVCFGDDFILGDMDKKPLWKDFKTYLKSFFHFF